MLPRSIKKLFPSQEEKAVRRYAGIARSTLQQAKDWKDEREEADWSDFRTLTGEEILKASLDRAFLLAGPVEIVRQEFGLSLHPEQIIGALVLNDGGIAELKTGEGKTLVALLGAYLEALSGPVHVVTVNDYLVERDAAQATRILGRLGMSVGRITAVSTHEERVEAYACNVTYVTGSELGFDYLRDSIATSQAMIVAPKRRSVIVDEVDSLLIDEARTPIIISEKTTATAPMVSAIMEIVEGLPASGFDFEHKEKIATPKEETWADLEDALRTAALLAPDVSLQSDSARAIAHRVEQAIRARFSVKKDQDYILRAGRVLLVDQNTGQISDGRSYADGLHQAIEARNGLEQTAESSTVASVSYQNLFRSYDRICGLTGTAASDAKEFQFVYGLKTHVVPTHKPVVRLDEKDEVYLTEREKVQAVVEEITTAHLALQPVLVGSRSIEKCEEIAHALAAAGFTRIPASQTGEIDLAVEAALAGKARHVFRVLDAKDPEFEAAIIAQAGIPGAITVATTIAGRGTDVKLGGDLAFRLSGLDEDDHERRRKIAEEAPLLGRMARQKGGLFVLGTERLDNRRMDDQFRGRSGRQGDPGRSKFLLCLQDDILRHHEGIAKISKMTRMTEGQALSSRFVDKAIEAAQRSREATHFEMRSSLLRMDGVLEEQRKLFADIRRDAIASERVDEWFQEIMADVIDDIVDRHVPERQLSDLWAYTAVEEEYARSTMIKVPVRDLVEKRVITDPDTLAAHLKGIAREVHASRRAAAAQSHDAVVSRILLHCLDTMWRRHVEGVEYMRKGLFLRDGTRDGGPLATYRVDAAKSFSEMLMEWRRQSVRTVRSLQFTGTMATTRPSAVIEKVAS